MIRTLTKGDESSLLRYLLTRPNDTIFLRSNASRVGLTDSDARYHGAYAARFEDDQIVGVAAHYWNGIVIVSGADVGPVARAAVAQTNRALLGILGVSAEVETARQALAPEAKVAVDDTQDLFALDLAQLKAPAGVTDRVRAPRSNEVATLVEWRRAYSIEALRDFDGPELRARCRQEVMSSILEGRQWVLEVDGEMVACAAFNARLPDCVQVGGVYTPVELRGRGYARQVVGGALQLAQAEGVERSVLFTSRGNDPARRAYEALGYEIVGDYHMLFFAEPQHP